jgi:cellulose synthase/poly-beta-1,6-N-acetylglucosamine synthase-like glycosyltransferase
MLMDTELISIAETLFWANLGILIYVYVGYPTILGGLALLVKRPKPEPGYHPRLSILIAAYNEETDIRRKVKETLALDYPADRMEVLVLSDASTDQTDSIVRSIIDPRVRLLRLEQRRGKTGAQNAGVRASSGEIIVFSDATTKYHPQALRYLACNYLDAKVGAVSGRYHYFDREGNSPTGPGTIAFWNYENLIKRLQSRIRTLTGCCGCIYSVRKSVYTELPDHIVSDLVQPLWVIKKGYRVVFESRALAYEETTKSASEEFAMRVRIITGGISGLMSVAELLKPWRHFWVAFQLLSHKVSRWLVPLFLPMLFATNAVLAIDSGVYRLAFVLQSLFYFWALLAVWVPVNRWWKPLTVPLYFCTLNAAALMGLIGAWLGRQYSMWEPVRR